jgi:transcription termination factor Rho
MDDVIYEEFKGTGNMELHLDRKLAERRIFPAIDILRSGTRREELLFSEDTLAKIWLFRRMFSAVSNDSGSPIEGTERVLESLKSSPSNTAYLDNLSGSMGKSQGRTSRRS